MILESELHTHGNKIELDKVTVGDHDVSIVSSAHVGLGNVTDDAQLKRAAGDIDSFAEKTEPVETDIVLMEDSENSNTKKKLQLANINFIMTGSSWPNVVYVGKKFTRDDRGLGTDYTLKSRSPDIWVPGKSRGPMEIHVNPAGEDDKNHGFSGGSDAFKTFMTPDVGAVAQIPELLGGDLNIIPSDDIFAENIIIQGKKFSGAYELSVDGTWTILETQTSCIVVKGSGATHGKVTKAGAWAGDSYSGKIAYFVADDEYRVIVSHTDDTITLAGLAPSSTTQTVIIYTQGTIVNYIKGQGGQKSLVINFVKYTAGFSGANFLEMTWNNCWFSSGIVSMGRSHCVFVRCHIQTTLNLTNACTGSIINNYGDITSGRFAQINGSNVFIGTANVIDGNGSGSDGLLVFGGGIAGMFSGLGTGYPLIRNWTTGLIARDGGVIFDTGNNQYLGNITDETPSGAIDPAFID